MAYIDPATVLSPKDAWELTSVLWNTGQGDWSLAQGTWNKNPCLAMRWNGSDGIEGIGNPQSRGHPTWFIIPDDLEDAIRKEADLLHQIRRSIECNIVKHNGSSAGAWRVEAVLGQHILNKLGNDELRFSLPTLPNRLCVPDTNHTRVRVDGEMQGCFIQGRYFGNLYSSGIPEDENPTPVDAVRDAISQNIVRAVKQTGLVG